MGRTRSFSIYLLKPGFEAKNSLKKDHKLKDKVEANSLPEGASLFLLDSTPRPPWWKDYFGIGEELTQVSKGALLFLPVATRCFALCFGHVSHNLLDTSLEYDFGLRVTLNCVDADQLKSTDSLEPGVGRRQRTQLPVGSDLTLFDFDRDSSILRRLTGKVKEAHKHLFKHATGASNLRISSTIEATKLGELCNKLLELYESEDYLNTFPDIQNISPVRDPSIQKRLTDNLLESIRAQDPSVSLTVPDLINYDDNARARFFGAKAPSLLYDEVFIGSYYEYLESQNVKLDELTSSDLRNHSLALTNEDSSTRERHSLFKSLVFDTALDGETYHLCDGEWYKVEKDYVKRLENYLDPLCIEIGLPPYNHETEGAYNKSVSDGDPSFICLDTENISLDGQTEVEPCDLLALENGHAVFWHVKISTLSSTLSHLFNQGANALELIRAEQESLAKLRALVEKKASDAHAKSICTALDDWKHRVMFAIVTHKDKSGKSRNLPLFSRISLMRNAKSLHVRGVSTHFGFVADKSEKKAAKKKPRAKKNKENNE